MVRHADTNNNIGSTRLGRPKLKERERAIELRTQGLTYSEIRKEVHVAKSSLSLWLGDVGLSQKQTQRITDKKRAAQRRGAAARRTERLDRTATIHTQSTIRMKKYLTDPLFLIGVALYWAEGSKQKEWNVSQPVAFSNMDVRTHQIMLLWVEKYLAVQREKLTYQLTIHATADVPHAVSYWKSHLALSAVRFKTYNKNNIPKSSRHNAQKQYYGVLRVVVPMSTDLNRQIAAWIDGMIQYVR